MKKMGGLSGLMGFMPGMGKIRGMMENANVDDGLLGKQEAIILSMTAEERRAPDVLNGSRRKRIALGSGTSVQEVNKVLSQFAQMRQMMRGMVSGKMPGMPPMAGALGGSGGGKNKKNKKHKGGGNRFRLFGR